MSKGDKAYLQLIIPSQSCWKVLGYWTKCTVSITEQRKKNKKKKHEFCEMEESWIAASLSHTYSGPIKEAEEI